MLKLVCKRPSRAHLRASTNLRSLAFFHLAFQDRSQSSSDVHSANKKSFLFSDTADEDSVRSLDPAGIFPDPELQHQAAELSITIKK
jgi:hypothetical protein